MKRPLPKSRPGGFIASQTYNCRVVIYRRILWDILIKLCGISKFLLIALFCKDELERLEGKSINDISLGYLFPIFDHVIRKSSL